MHRTKLTLMKTIALNMTIAWSEHLLNMPLKVVLRKTDIEYKMWSLERVQFSSEIQKTSFRNLQIEYFNVVLWVYINGISLNLFRSKYSNEVNSVGSSVDFRSNGRTWGLVNVYIFWHLFSIQKWEIMKVFYRKHLEMRNKCRIQMIIHAKMFVDLTRVCVHTHNLSQDSCNCRAIFGASFIMSLL